MSQNTVITEGLGSFGDIAHVITDGFDINSANANATILTQAFGALTADSAFIVTEGFFSSSAPPPPPPPPVITTAGGVRKTGRKYRVRRADFSSQKAYEFALRQALLESNFGIVPDDEPAPVREQTKKLKVKGDVAPKLTDTAIELSAADMAKLQAAAEMEEKEMLLLFIEVIEEEDC